MPFLNPGICINKTIIHTFTRGLTKEEASVPETEIFPA